MACWTQEKSALAGKPGFDRFYGIHIHVDSYYKVLDCCPVYLDGEEHIPPIIRDFKQYTGFTPSDYLKQQTSSKPCKLTCR